METHGRYDKKFQSIVDCFENQFELGLDIGSSLAITCEGEIVVDCLLYTSPSPRDA